eukprot:341399-Chlamydomonas_euryale.AAC.2
MDPQHWLQPLGRAAAPLHRRAATVRDVKAVRCILAGTDPQRPDAAAAVGALPHPIAWLDDAADGDAVPHALFRTVIGVVTAASSAEGISDAAIMAAMAVARAAAGGGPGGASLEAMEANTRAVAAEAELRHAELALPRQGATDRGEASELEAAVVAPEDAEPSLPKEGEASAATQPRLPPPLPYVHPSGCRKYLEAHVVPLLRRGMFEMVRELEADRLKLGSGADWTEDGYLPPGWKPFAPFRWLSNWLLEHAPPPTQQLSADGFSSYRADAKAELIFEALDASGSGSARVATGHGVRVATIVCCNSCVLRRLRVPTLCVATVVCCDSCVLRRAAARERRTMRREVAWARYVVLFTIPAANTFGRKKVQSKRVWKRLCGSDSAMWYGEGRQPPQQEHVVGGGGKTGRACGFKVEEASCLDGACFQIGEAWCLVGAWMVPPMGELRRTRVWHEGRGVDG